MTTPQTSTNQRRTEPIPPSGATGDDAPVSGDVNGVDVPSPVPAQGTSEGSVPALAPEGRADGETDVQMPATTSF